MPTPPISALIDAPRQSNFRLRASFFAAIITTAATPDSHPDCRALLIKIAALQKGAVKAGLNVHGVEIDADTGNIRLAVKPPDQPSAEQSVNEWDEVR
jgi:hypothetical protein